MTINDGMILDARQDDGATLVAETGRTGTEIVRATHNYCNKTTWFGDSTRVEEEPLYNSGDDLTFSASFPNWIDMIHGKVHAEDYYNSQADYSVKIRVDGVEKTQRMNWDSSGGDYVVNYASGSVTFFAPVTNSDVTADFNYANDSAWFLVPPDGKSLNIEDAEAQFSGDVAYNDSILFQVWGPIDIFAPQLVDNPYPSGTKIPIATEEFKTLDQIIDEAQGAYPMIPPIGGPRGKTQVTYGFPFKYGTVREIKSSLGMELRVSLKNNLIFGGERATATFYMILKNEE